MTDPFQGKFASETDVTGRFEGTIPPNRLPWVDLRISDVESELMGKIPSLRKSIEEITAESIAAGDEDRPNRVKSLVCEKVLDLYRNPGGPTTQHSTTTPDITISRAWASGDLTRGRVQFTCDELDSVRLRKRKKKFGTVAVAPWQPTRSPRCCP